MRQSVDLRDAQAKVSELQALADAWEQEARSQSRKRLGESKAKQKETFLYHFYKRLFKEAFL